MIIQNRSPFLKGKKYLRAPTQSFNQNLKKKKIADEITQKKTNEQSTIKILSNHVMSRSAHAQFLGVEGEVFTDDLLARLQRDLDRTVGCHGEDILDATLDRLTHARFQLRLVLKQRQLERKARVNTMT